MQILLIEMFFQNQFEMGIRNNPTEDNFNSLRDDNIDPIIISSDDDDNYSDDEVPDGYQVFFRKRTGNCHVNMYLAHSIGFRK